MFLQPLYGADRELKIADGFGGSIPRKTELILTPQEQAWLADHPVIVFGGAIDLPPFNYIAANGQYQGYNVDLLKIINELIGAEIKIVSGEWAGLQEKVRQRLSDGLIGPSITEETQSIYAFHRTLSGCAQRDILPWRTTHE